MSDYLNKKEEKIQVGKKIKETASAAASDIKGVAKDTVKAAGDAAERVKEGTKGVLKKVEKKLG